MVSSRYRYQDFIDELAMGRTHGVFIDDTASPGLSFTPEGLHPERKSWVGVVVSRRYMPEVLEQFPQAIQELQVQTRAAEFHFADVYSVGLTQS